VALPQDETAFGRIEEKIADIYAIFNLTFPDNGPDGEHAPLDWPGVFHALVDAGEIAAKLATETVIGSASTY